MSEEEGLCPAFSGFPKCRSGPAKKAKKEQRKGEKAEKTSISGKGGQTPLEPPFVTTPICGSPILGECREMHEPATLFLFNFLFKVSREAPGRKANMHTGSTLFIRKQPSLPAPQ